MSMGFYEYTGDDGKVYRVNYNSGKGGFMPMGDHIHPIPPQIQKALEYTARKEAERAARAAQYQATPAPIVYEEQQAQEPVLEVSPEVQAEGQESVHRPARYNQRRYHG